jgi:hypothetical protein
MMRGGISNWQETQESKTFCGRCSARLTMFSFRKCKTCRGSFCAKCCIKNFTAPPFLELSCIACITDARTWENRYKTYVPDFEHDCCQHCKTKFTFFNRRHHCRWCGGLYCEKCSPIRHHNNLLVRACSDCCN